MPKKLVSQEEMEELCPYVVGELMEFMKEHEDFKVIEPEIIIYALAEIISNQIGLIDLEDKDKGAVVSTIVTGLCDIHEQPLAFHHEFLKTLIEQKSSTVH